MISQPSKHQWNRKLGRVSSQSLRFKAKYSSSTNNLARDEVLYHAKIHPEQYSNTFSSAQLKQLHKSIRFVCQTAVDLLADSSKFPDDWLFKHRWGKGKKDKIMALPSGEKITFLTVGGRTSCIVPSVQKKTGAVAGDIKTEKTDLSEEDRDEEPDSDSNKKVVKSKKISLKTENKNHTNSRKKKAAMSEEAVDEHEVEVESEEEEKPKNRKRKAAPIEASKGSAKSPDQSKRMKKEQKQNVVEDSGISTGQRRSTRGSKKGN